MRGAGLFEGYGGLTMAVRHVIGGELAWVSEIDPKASRILAHNYPDVPNLGDVTAIDWASVEPVDWIALGFPCQDISNAGRRAGIGGARSGLWSYGIDAIRALRPRYVFVENVSALLVRGFDVVAADLAASGYRFAWTVLGAGEIGAPHKRDRLFLVATADTAHDGRERCRQARDGRSRSADLGVAVADSPDDGRHERWPEPTRVVRGSDVAERRAPTAHSDGSGRKGGEPAPRRDVPARGTAPDAQDNGRNELDDRSIGDAACGSGIRHAAGSLGAPPVGWGQYEPAIRRWEGILGRPAPEPTVTSARGGRVLSPVFVEWLMGLPAGHVTDVPGLSRNAQLKALGNGVVPQQGTAAFRHLLPLLTAGEVAA